MQIKKFITLWLILFWIVIIQLNYANWEYDNSTNSKNYQKIEIVPKLDYAIDWNSMKLYWSKGWIWFQYYKVVFSSSNSDPKYPEDSYIYYTTNIDETFYKIENFESWYYRICIINYWFYEFGQNEDYRKCSNVLKLENNITSNSISNSISNSKPIESTKNVSNTQNNELVNENYSISESTKKYLENIINKFELKLNNKWLSNDQKVELLKNISLKLEKLKNSKPKYTMVVEYLNSKIDELIKKYDEWFEEIWNLFDL